MPSEPIRLLFVCVENACRSQIAEAFARHYGGPRVLAASAGSRPRGSVDTTTIAVMAEQGIDLRSQRSKGLEDLPSHAWDAVVTMGCGDACPSLPAKQRLDWQIPNPAGQSLEGYRQIRDLIEQRVQALLDQFRAGGG